MKKYFYILLVLLAAVPCFAGGNKLDEIREYTPGHGVEIDPSAGTGVIVKDQSINLGFTECSIPYTNNLGYFIEDNLGFCYDNGNKTLDVMQYEGLKIRTCKVDEAAGIIKGQAVALSGALGENCTVELADNTVHFKAHAYGIANETKSDGQNIEVALSGELINIDTSGFTEGGIIHLAAAGAIQEAIPTSGAHVHLGRVVKVDATAGNILVSVDGYVHDIRATTDIDGKLAVGSDDATRKFIFENYSATDLGYFDGAGLFSWTGTLQAGTITDGTASLTGGNLASIGTIGAAGDADLITLTVDKETVAGTLAATTVTGENVTSGADPGHTHTGASLSNIDHDTDLINVSADDHHSESHTIASHSDTTATGAELNTLTDNSMADALHRHSELSASDGTPDQQVVIDTTGNVGINNSTPRTAFANYLGVEFGDPAVFVYNSAAGLDSYLASNIYLSATGWKYTAPGGGSFIQQTSGEVAIKVAGAGAADAAFSPITAVTVDSIGNVGIHNSTPPRTALANYLGLELDDPLSFIFNAAAGLDSYLASNVYLSATGWKYTAAGGGSYIQQNSGEVSINVAGAGAADAAFSPITAVTVDSTGNVGVGTATPQAGFHNVGDTRLGDQATNYTEIGTTGDTVFVGGAGLCFGEISVSGNVTADTVSTATWTQVARFDTNGPSNNTTPDHTNDHITITKAGIYMVNISLSFSGTGSVDWIFQLYKNNGATAFGNVLMERKLGASGDIGAVPLSGLIDVAVNDTIELWMYQAEGVNKDITIKNCTFTISQKGGT